MTTVEIADLSRSGGEGNLMVHLLYSNPNKSELTIEKAPILCKINQKELGKFVLSQPLTLPGKSTDTLKVRYAFTPDHIYPGFLSRQFGAISSKRVQITLSGKVVFEKEGKKEAIKLDVPVDYSEAYKISN